MGAADPSQLPVPVRFLFPGSAGSPIRRVLLIGFAAIFVLWLASAYVLGQRVLDAEQRVVAMTTKLTEGEEVLFAMRERVLLSAVLVRDAALENRPEGMAALRESLRVMRADIERAQRQYLPFVDSAVEREHWTRLRAELDEYWASLSPLLSGQVSGRDAQAFLRRTVVPGHDLVLRISEDLRTLNQDALREQQAALTDLHRHVRVRLWWTSGLAVAFGFAVALLATRHIGRLEAWIRRQHRQEREHTRELQRLSAELEDAQEIERRRIARDLHDEIGQALMTTKLDLSVVDRSAQVAGSAAIALAEARTSIDAAIRTVRDLSQLLHPPMLDDFGLAATLKAYVRRYSERTGVRTELVLDRMEARVPAAMELCAYRVVQEALTNVAKHARATTCRVFLHRLPHSLLVTVEDDGIGLVPVKEGAETHRGVGLVGVRERVSRAGGTLTIDGAPAKGTRVTIELPVPAGDAGVEAGAAQAVAAATPAGAS
jgi:signal transduction histidine kinase